MKCCFGTVKIVSFTTVTFQVDTTVQTIILGIIVPKWLNSSVSNKILLFLAGGAGPVIQSGRGSFTYFIHDFLLYQAINNHYGRLWN